MTDKGLRTAGKDAIFPHCLHRSACRMSYTERLSGSANPGFSQLAQTVVHMAPDPVAKSHHHVDQRFELPLPGGGTNIASGKGIPKQGVSRNQPDFPGL